MLTNEIVEEIKHFFIEKLNKKINTAPVVPLVVFIKLDRNKSEITYGDFIKINKFVEKNKLNYSIEPSDEGGIQFMFVVKWQ